MQLDVFPDKELARTHTDGPLRLLLEGDWDSDLDSTHSLNELVTEKMAWIDHQASLWYQRLVRNPAISNPSLDLQDIAYLYGLELRYYLVKILRCIAGTHDLLSSGNISSIRLFCTTTSSDYAILFGQLCSAFNIPLKLETVHTCTFPEPTILSFLKPSTWLPPSVRFLRKKLATGIITGLHSFPPDRNIGKKGRRILFCGNLHHFRELFRELQLRKDSTVFYLAQQPSLRALIWSRSCGVHFLCCPAPDRSSSRPLINSPLPPCSLSTKTVDCRAIIHNWLHQQYVNQGAALKYWREYLPRLLHQVQPDTVLLDEDVTPFKRLVLTMVDKPEIDTAVLQHGAPYVPFGFTPLVAKKMLAWGRSSEKQFRRWGVDSNRILLTGAPKHDSWCRDAEHESSPPSPDKCLLFLATPHHQDHRPDLVAFQLTERTNACMLRMALEALRTLHDYKMQIKLHPRSDRSCFVTDILSEFPDLISRVEILRHGTPYQLALKAACVLSCASSAGIEAMLAHTPVIQIMPPGSVDLVNDKDWGFVTTVRKKQDLTNALHGILNQTSRTPDLATLSNNFSNIDIPGTNRVTDYLLGNPPYPLNSQPEQLPQNTTDNRSDSVFSFKLKSQEKGVTLP